MDCAKTNMMLNRSWAERQMSHKDINLEARDPSRDRLRHPGLLLLEYTMLLQNQDFAEEGLRIAGPPCGF